MEKWTGIKKGLYMITIYGKYTNAIVYTTNQEAYAFDEHARKQLQMICDHPSAAGSRIRVMPDVHPGKVGTIGLTMTVGDTLLPSLVGVDIGCGMTIAKIMATDKTKTGKIEYQKLDTLIRENVPSGGGIRKKSHRFSEKLSLSSLHCRRAIDEEKARLSIGTLGGGNHFIEIDKDTEGELYLVIHSGSRHLGVEVTEYYLREGQKEAQQRKRGHASYEMTCLEGDLLQSYLHDLWIIQEFARLNREAMMDEITKGMRWKVADSYSCIHNYVDFSADVPLLRKGAIRAKEGEPVIIPINMRDGIILGTGLGNPDWNYSAPHGSGRIYRRSQVQEHYTLSQFKKAMEGIHSTCINKDTLDEAPFAYRAISDIMEVIKDTVHIQKIITPIYNFKAGGRT